MKNNWFWICFSSFLFIKCESFFEVPQIEAFLFPSHVVADKNISAFCSTKEDAEFFWFKDDKMLTNSSNVVIISKENYTVIIIRSLTVQFGGNYTCIARNKFGMSSKSATLTVITPPKELIESLDLVAVIGEKISLECLPQESPKKIMKWERRDQNETIIDTVSFKLSNGSVLLNAMQVENDGVYECIQDSIPLINRRENLVKEKIPARFDDKFTKIKVKKGDSVSLPCEAIGDQPLIIIWKRDGKELKKISGKRYDIFETFRAKSLKSELFLREVDMTDCQLYTCTAENSYGKDEKDINLLAMEVPSIPLNLKMQEVLKRSINVSWSSPFTGNSPITKYVIQYWKDADSGGRQRLEEREVSSVKTSTVIDNLHPGIRYGLDITAVNALGSGEPSEIMLFTTGEDKPSGAPVDVNVDINGTDSLVVTWKPPSKSERNGELKGYYIGYKINFDSSQPHSIRKVNFAPEGMQEYFIKDLRKDAAYSIFVQAFNSAGNGPPSQNVIIRTLVRDIPLAPTVSVVSITPNSVNLKWQSMDHNSAITGYIIHYQKKEESWKRVTITSANETSCNLTGLQNGTFYQMYVTSNSDFGEGYPSSIITVETNAGDNATSLLAGITGQQHSKIDMTHIIPVTASVLIAVVVSVAVCVWVFKTKSRRNLERSIQVEKRSIFAMAESQMYDRVDKKRSLSAYHIQASKHFVTPYSTMLIKGYISNNDLKDVPKKAMKSFLHLKMEDKCH